MSRSLKTRKPNLTEMRQLDLMLEISTDVQVQRRAEVLLHYAVGLNGVDIAEALHAHPNTVYADLRAFSRQGLACLQPLSVGGAPAHITPKQLAEIWQLAECTPGEFGLPYGRWSLANFQEFLVKQRHVLKRISCEHLRRVLKKRTFGFAASSVN